VQDPEGRVETEVVSGLTLALAEALRNVLGVQAQIIELSRPPEGLDSEEEQKFQREVLKPGSAFLRFLEPLVMRIDFHEKRISSFAMLIECLMHAEGDRVAGELVVEVEDLSPDQLLALLQDDFFLAPPVWNSPLALEISSHQEEGLLPLSNAGALGYLMWGLLRQEAFWAEEGHDREAFILAVLERGFDSPRAAEVASRILETPLIGPRESLRKTRRTGRLLARSRGFEARLDSRKLTRRSWWAISRS
jgi:hypothetical protein